jgi:hypothetical protein
VRAPVGVLKLHSVGGYIAALRAVRSAEHSSDIEQGAVTQWVMYDVEAGATPQGYNVASNVGSDVTHRYDRAKGYEYPEIRSFHGRRKENFCVGHLNPKLSRCRPNGVNAPEPDARAVDSEGVAIDEQACGKRQAQTQMINSAIGRPTPKPPAIIIKANAEASLSGLAPHAQTCLCSIEPPAGIAPAAQG